ncbi:MAG: NAD(P)-dependent alcohol dehydrogenase [Cyclobacteriaceae bacterium]
MKAVLWTRYGTADLLTVGELQKPVPKDDELLIKVHAATVTPGDCEIRRFDIHVLFWLPLRLFMGIRKPRRPVLGMELSGEVVNIGNDVQEFKPGDQILSDAGIRFGAHAEYVCLKSSSIMAVKPQTLSFEEVATLPTAGLNALHYLRKGNIKPGQKVLIKGASGCFGAYAVQLAKLFGAEVTGVDRTEKLAVLCELGADHVIDYTRENYLENGQKYDVIFDVVGNSSITAGMKSLTDNGRYILATPWVRRVIEGKWTSWTSRRKFTYSLAKYRREDLEYLTDLMEAGKIRAVIDKVYPLEEVPLAHKYVEAGDKTGHVVIKITDSL